MCSINNCGDNSYKGSHVGETERPLKYLINEHKIVVRKDDN